MQAPPPGPIGPGGYPRPEGYGKPEKFAGDMAVGIIMIVLNAIGSCVGGLAALGGGGMKFAGDSVKAQMAKQGNDNLSQAQIQELGTKTLIFGIVLLLGTILMIIGSVGIIKGARWGFSMTLTVGVLLLIGSFFPVDIIGILIGLFAAVYSGLRLFGNVGPKPT